VSNSPATAPTATLSPYGGGCVDIVVIPDEAL
jgi:hypothetical protein